MVIGLMVGSEAECRFEISLNEDDRSEQGRNGEAFEGDSFHLGTD